MINCRFLLYCDSAFVTAASNFYLLFISDLSKHSFLRSIVGRLKACSTSSPILENRMLSSARVLRRGLMSRLTSRWLSLPAHQVVGLPALSPTMSSGKLTVFSCGRAQGGRFDQQVGEEGG